MPKIYLTTKDKEKLLGLIDAKAKTGETPTAVLRDLRTEISQAVVVPPEGVPPDTITMNTRVLLQLEDEEMDVTLTYPDDADMAQGRVSIFAPVGMAILGYSRGDSINWKVPGGDAQILVKEILYQPEASGAVEA